MPDSPNNPQNSDCTYKKESQDHKTLDNDHVIVDNKDETLVHNTTPFTEDIIRRLSEKEDEKTEEPLFQPQQLFY